MREEAVIALAMIMFIASAVVLLVVAMINRRHLREMAHRERLAMIERGLIPSPEANPAAFEAATGLGSPPTAIRGDRYRTAGVAMIGVGLGLAMLIAGVGGVVGVAIGIGGAWVMLGGALLVNYFLMNRNAGSPYPPQTGWTPPRSSNREPPSNVAP